MTDRRTGPFGSWRSPITPEMIATGIIGLDQIAVDGQDVYWIEARPREQGRHVIVRRGRDGTIADAIPSPYNARTRVHEYGGGAYAVRDGVVFFSHFADQRMYRKDPERPPRPITPDADLRFADAVIDAGRRRLICVREDHTTGAAEAVNTLVSLPMEAGDGGRILVSGNDFYSSPRLSPDGSRLAWLTWNHPDMPWDGTELWVGAFGSDGMIARAERVAGGPAESIIQPEWTPGGALCFISDVTGWWNPYWIRDGHRVSLWEGENEFAGAQWTFGMSTYAVAGSSHLLCAYKGQGGGRFADLDPEARTLRPYELAYTNIWSVRWRGDTVLFGAASPAESPAIVELDPATGRFEVLRRSRAGTVDTGYVSAPEPIDVPTEHGRSAHAFFYAPQNRDYAGPAGERPPLIVRAHGGPTGATSSSLSLDVQYWTSRGFAYLDVNYGGSTGYGRAYRERLNGEWGVVDVDDCVNGARYLVDRGVVDGRRLAIHGSSAGGYTTLCALVFRDTFTAGASYYGISDLEVFRRDTHKFESRYDQHLIGPYPERRDVYWARSPIHFIDRLRTPLILFQGLEDKIVPPNQAEMMFEAARAKGIPVAYLAYPGEQHGFRRAENIKRTLEAELFFYSKVFKFTPADPVEAVEIENL
jgi:dipeptidyl aminopeptidase/acylaminoacyl peptidase